MPHTDAMRETIDGYDVTTGADGIITISPALYGAEAEVLLRRYVHLGAAVERRLAATHRRDAEVRHAAEALAEAARDRRQQEADARVAACSRHRAASERTVSWTHCVARGGECSGRSHGAVIHVDECHCGARRSTEVNGQAGATSGWHSPAVRS